MCSQESHSMEKMCSQKHQCMEIICVLMNIIILKIHVISRASKNELSLNLQFCGSDKHFILCCHMLWNQQCHFNIYIFKVQIRETGLEMILRAMQHHDDHEHILQAGCRTLANITTTLQTILDAWLDICMYH